MLYANSYIIQLNYLTERTRHDLGKRKNSQDQARTVSIKDNSDYVIIGTHPASPHVPVVARGRFQRCSRDHVLIGI